MALMITKRLKAILRSPSRIKTPSRCKMPIANKQIESAGRALPKGMGSIINKDKPIESAAIIRIALGCNKNNSRGFVNLSAR